MAEVLFIALPSGDLPYIFPLGSIDLVRRLGRATIGRYASEWTLADVRRARVVLLPVHWYFSLKPAIETARRLKAINPKVTIISGGYTSGAFYRPLLEQAAIDFVVRGDAEQPLVELVHALLDGGDPRQTANLAWRGGETELAYRVDEATLAASDNREIGWFPTFAKAALASQRAATPAFLYPWVVVARGCAFDCPTCFASQSAQRTLAGRGLVIRPPEAVRDDLRYYAARPEIRTCHFNSDFFSTAPAGWAAAALPERFDLTAYYEWYRLPAPAALDFLFARFSGVVFGFFHQPRAVCAHDDGGNGHDFSRLREAIRYCRGRARVLLYVTPALVKAHPDYRREVLTLGRERAVSLRRFEDPVLPRAVELDRDDEWFLRLLTESERQEKRLRRQHRLLRRMIRWAPGLFGALGRIAHFRARLAIYSK